ncbi:outer membrane protein [Methylobacterium brachythecii]|uniref:Opacity protein-like surface antigen n=1 Tax=Methylobacterium brachythecii TaxID=1176177 RepID=A0A7W6F6G9_9HYPH|nr:outer membrane beta-barrel protein [Methylobacterium brachythecii]MBB3902407.1 opacity protein-like surface antigen [Methylobacterium brachythecii]GLS42256.1 outer surface protein [Methylobacterium brachythecii]
MRSSDCLRTAIAGLGVAVALSTGPASAADLLRYARSPEAIVAAEPVESGWYLRADATASDFGKPSDATPPDPSLPPYVGLRLSSEAGYGGGVGYRVNQWLRVDATIDQRMPSRFRTYSSGSHFATGYNIETGDLSALTGFLNAYADLGTWWGLTPYVGGGIGFAENSFHGNYTQTTCTVAGCDGNSGTGTRVAVTRPDHGLSSFAWNLTAGASYQLGQGLSLDAAYRYVDLGGAKSGVDSFGASTRLKDLHANEVRVGLRYQFAGGLLPMISQNPYGN